MKKSFAEQIIDSMVDENGHCGERGLSPKQFDVLSKYLEPQQTVDAGGWQGDYSFVQFTITYYIGIIGRYYVTLKLYEHFHPQCSVVEIDKWCEEVPDTSNSTWKHNVKNRVELDLFVLNEGSFETYYGTKRVYTLVDSDNNVYVWFTTSYLAYRHPECGDYDVFANTGDTVHVKATVKEHTEFLGVKQTVLTRCHVLDVKKYNKVA